MSPMKTPPEVAEKIKKESFFSQPETGKTARNLGCFYFAFGIFVATVAFWLLSLIF